MDFVLPFALLIVASLVLLAVSGIAVALLLHRKKRVLARVFGLIGGLSLIILFYFGSALFADDPELGLKKRAWPFAWLAIKLIDNTSSGPEVNSHAGAGELAFGAGLYETAIEEYTLALQDADSGDRSRLFRKMGWCYHNMGIFDQAAACYDSALLEIPDDADAWYRRGANLARIGDVEQTVVSFDSSLFYGQGIVGKPITTDYDTAKAIHPFRHKAWTLTAYHLRQKEKYQEALACYDSALTWPGAYPNDHARAWYNRGTIFKELHDYENAVLSFDSALVSIEFPVDTTQQDIYKWDRNTDTFSIWRDRCYALRELGRYDEALASIDSALSCLTDPNNQHFLNLKREIEDEKQQTAAWK